MDFEVHCMFILPTELSLFNYDKVKSVLQSVTPLIPLEYLTCVIHKNHQKNDECNEMNIKIVI